MSTNLLRRIVVAAIAIPVVLGLIYLGGWTMAGALAFLGVVGADEIYSLASRRGIRPLRASGCLGAALLPIGALTVLTIPQVHGSWFLLILAVWVMAVMALALAFRSPSEGSLAATATTILGALYAGGLPAFILLLRETNLSSAWAATWLTFLPLVAIWICDTLAMTGGAVFGGPKLAPVLSPGKTWAGALTGAAGATIAAPLYGWLVLNRVGVEIPAWQLAVLGLILAAVGQIGDLAESMLKREAGVKDSGGFFPGHGGVLDRLDSLYWAIPVCTLMLKAFGTV